MARAHGRQTINIEEELYEYGEDFDFFQAVRLLSRLQVQAGEASSTSEALKKLRIHPELSLDYPDSAISSIEEDEKGGAEIVTTFMGLYGISSPLPNFYTEELLDEEWHEQNASKDFLDIIHHHLYPVLFEAWEKYRFGYQAVEQKNHKYWDVLFSLIGLSDQEFRSLAKMPERFLPYLGMLAQRQKSALGLETILKNVLSTDLIEIESSVLRQVPIPKEQFCRLGGAQLGETSVIGDSIEDRMGCAHIHIEGITQEKFHQFLNDKEFIEFIWLLMDFYLIEPIEIELILHLTDDTVKPAVLGLGAWSSLGKDTWLDGNHQQVTRVVLSREDCLH